MMGGGIIVEYHWWPDCPEWPVDEASDTSGPDMVHRVAASRDQVTCAYCRNDPDVREPRD